MGPGFGMDQGGMGPGDMGGRGMRGLTQDDFDARTREHFARMDKNSDGVLDRAEIEAGLQERRGRWGHMGGRDGADGARGERNPFARLDTDRDGKVTREEFLARAGNRFNEADLNGDGRLTDADLPPMMRGRGAIERIARDGGRGPLRFLQGVEVKDGAISREAVLAAAGREFDRLDSDRNNVIDQADRDAMRKASVDYAVARFVKMFGGADGKVTREQFFTKARQRFAEMDLNGDGRLGPGEVHGRPGFRERMRDYWRGDRGQGGFGGPGMERGPNPGGPGVPGGTAPQPRQ
jgi:Ca2+-binding EF-hand superfamily protein